MPSFFKRLSYSFGNEDWLTEHKALQIEPDSRVLCITASGDRPLNLLTKDCTEIVSLDANPYQNHLLELKKTALKHLNDDDYLAFMGVHPCVSRKETLKQLSAHLPAETSKYWHHYDNLIYDGIIYQGAVERWLRRLSYIWRLCRRTEIQGLFSTNTLEEQTVFLKEQWNHKLWKTGFNFSMQSWIRHFLFKDPGICEHFDSSIKPGKYFYDRMMNTLNQNLARQSALLCLMFIGKVHQEALPPYLHSNQLNNIRRNLGRLTYKTDDIITYLNSVPEGSFDRFSLSDVASYLDYENYLKMLKGMYRAAKPNARFCLRQLMTSYKLPEGLKPYFSREPELEDQLKKEDRAFVYDFTVGTIIKE